VESKTTLERFSSVDQSYNPAQESTIQLFESESLPEEQQWRFGVRDWLVFICIVILAMMDAFDSTVMITVLPVGYESLDKYIQNEANKWKGPSKYV